MSVAVVVAGAAGRMGRSVAAVLADEPRARWVDDLPRAGATRAASLAAAEVVIDFTDAAATVALARECATRGGPALVLGATGLDAAQEAVIAEAARRVAIVRSENFSPGLNLLIGLVARAAAVLDPAVWDAEIVEMHHRRKRDAPSGSALRLGRAVARARDVRLEEVAERGRDGLTGPRDPGAIGFAALRGGGVVGDHSVIFAAEDEILTLSHSARDRRVFARGAVDAALWVVGRTPGLYDMQDVLGLRLSSSPLAGEEGAHAQPWEGEGSRDGEVAFV